MAKNSVAAKLQKLDEERQKLLKKQQEMENKFFIDLGRLMQQSLANLSPELAEKAKAIYEKHDVVFEA